MAEPGIESATAILKSNTLPPELREENWFGVKLGLRGWNVQK